MNNEIIKKLLARMNESEWVSGGVAVNVGWTMVDVICHSFKVDRRQLVLNKYETNSSSAGHGWQKSRFITDEEKVKKEK
jgi:hypothetical protein